MYIAISYQIYLKTGIETVKNVQFTNHLSSILCEVQNKYDIM
jgi:hypothetical protein